MDRIENLSATVEVDKKGLLQPLIEKLKNIPDTFIEIESVSTFPSYTVKLPEVNFSPRQAIEYMISRHKIIEHEIKIRPDLLRIVIYTYVPFSKLLPPSESKFIFTNNMSLTQDICIICYLYHLIRTREYFAVKVIQDLYYIMRDKYYIQDDCMKHEDQRAITAFKITYSFPSVSFKWFGFDPDINKLPSSSHFTFTTFPDLIIEPFHWHPMIASIIPRLENSKFVPLALLTAMSVKTNQMTKKRCGPNFEDCSLNVIYQRILALSHSKAFPLSLKQKLCTKWCIVYPNMKGVFKYSDYFAKYRSVAMNVISELKSQDPDLQTILSQI